MRSFTSERRAESSVPLLQKFVQTDAEAGFIARADVMTPDLPSYPIVAGSPGIAILHRKRKMRFVQLYTPFWRG